MFFQNLGRGLGLTWGQAEGRRGCWAAVEEPRPQAERSSSVGGEGLAWVWA